MRFAPFAMLLSPFRLQLLRISYSKKSHYMVSDIFVFQQSDIGRYAVYEKR